MRRTLIHIALLMLVVLSGCIKNKDDEERIKWKVTLDRDDKRPYGAYLAYQSLKYHFPDAKIQTLSSGFKYTNMDNDMKYNYGGRTLLILQGFNFYISDPEWAALKEFVNNGNEVIIFSSILDNKIEQELGCDKRLGGEEAYAYYSYEPSHNNRNVLRLNSDSHKQYGYVGHSIKSYFEITNPADTTAVDSASIGDAKNTPTNDTTAADSAASYTNTDSNNSSDNNTTSDNSTTTDNSSSSDNTTSTNDVTWSRPDTLGYAYGQPNFIRYTSGEGHITLHAAPLVLSNYFLLQPDNIKYLSAIWQTLPTNINRVYWSDYYTRNTEASSTGILWRYPATKLALILGLSVLLIYILFEGKRKQRIIPIIPPLKNDSVSFVETVGRLYYNKGNQANLAEKMMQQFLEWIRIHYLLNTNLLNDNFIHQLTIKSGQPEATVRGIVDMVHEIRLKDVKIDDAYLYQLYNTIQQFYKNHRI